MTSFASHFWMPQHLVDAGVVTFDIGCGIGAQVSNFAWVENVALSIGTECVVDIACQCIEKIRFAKSMYQQRWNPLPPSPPPPPGGTPSHTHKRLVIISPCISLC